MSGFIRSASKLVLRLVTAIIAVGVVIVVLFIGVFGYAIYHQSTAGKEWCESVLHKYETDRLQFLQSHEDRYRKGVNYLFPPAENKHAMAEFVIEKNGDYSCTYWHGGGIGAHGYRYTNKERKWVAQD